MGAQRELNKGKKKAHGSVKPRGKDLGMDVHGRRRTVKVIKARVDKARKRAERIGRLPIGRKGRAQMAGAALNTAICYSLGVCGISDAMLNSWRTMVLTAVAPGRVRRSCARGIMVMASRGEIDPWVVAPSQVVANWASFVWKRGRAPPAG